ncbi:MAG: sulfotransferase [Gammaproteobacteria bacterium]
MPKVFVIGFNKSATSSLHEVFRALGKPAYHQGTGRRGKWRSGEDLELLQTYDCFSDGPPREVDKLDAAFPGSKFILQVRDLEGWVYSRLAHNQKWRKIEPDLHAGEADTEEHVQHWIQNRNRFHMYVMDYFRDRSDDLLIVNFIRDQDAGNKVSRFLGSRKKLKRPDVNKAPSRERTENHKKIVDAAVRNLDIKLEEMAQDLLCPSLLDDAGREKYPADTSQL